MALIAVLSHDPNWRPDPFPGSAEAKLQGCPCPSQFRATTRFVFDSDCPIHALEKYKPS